MQYCKRSLAAVLAAALLCPTAASAAGLDAFVPQAVYTSGTFSDVSDTAWYAGNVASAYTLGLMQGSGDGRFHPSGQLTVAEMLALVCRVHAIYHTGSADFAASDPWYAVYADYAAAQGIVTDRNTLDYDAPATRAQFAAALSAALPAQALPAINDIADGAIPDVPADAADADAIYRLYRAGVLTGNDSADTFTPSAPIERSAVAALVTRAANPDLRQHITLQTAAAPDFSVYWENAIQAHNVYAFHADGTVTCYAAEPLGIDPDTLWASGTAQYRIAGSRMIYTENGETTTLELVTPASLAAMGASISETLPADTAFFYETGFSSDDPLQEPLYFVPSTVTVQPQGAEPAAPAALHAGDRLTLTGVLTQQTVQAPNGSPYTAYLLRLTAPQTFSLPDGEQTLTSVQLSFTQSGMQAHLGEQITVHGDVLFAHTAYHLTPVVLMNAAV